MNYTVRSAILGLAIGDALGVLVEFQSREDLRLNPVVDMRGYGTYNQPEGTWSDDTSMTLCLLDSIVGGKSEYDNGNGSLMRILPMAFYIIKKYGYECDTSIIVRLVHDVSSLTHGHIRSKIACVIYIMIAIELADGNDIETSVSRGTSRAFKHYIRNNEKEIENYMRIKNKNFKFLKEDKIKSSGYVVDTLEAAIWCLLNTNNYSDCVLKSVNLGSDTDTVAAVAGGLAGIVYGIDNIPSEWLEKLVKRDYIETLCHRLQN